MADMYFENLPSTNTPLIANNLDKLNDIKVSATEPTTGEKVWLQKGKNLFSKDTIFKGHIDTSTQKIVLDDGEYYIGYARISPNTAYTVSKNEGKSFRIATTSQTGVGQSYNITQANHTGTTITFTSGANDKYVYIFFYATSNGDTGGYSAMANSIQVEQGSTATTYEAYTEPKIYVKNNNNIYEDIDFLQSLQGVVLWTSDSTGAKGEMQLDIDLTNFEAYQVLYNAWNNMLPNNLIATGKLLKEYPYLLINFTGHYRRVWYDASTKKIEISAIDGGSEASYDSVPFKIIGFKKF